MQNNSTQAKQILILGGGTAGWMTAMILAKKLNKHGFEVSVLESQDIGIIGVGEGSTPALKAFFSSMGIGEEEWMPECNATYKAGITFDAWSTKPGFTEYFHPFKFRLDEQFSQAFFHSIQMRRQGVDIPAHPNPFFLSPLLVEKNLAPIPHYNFPFEPSYGYHFDSGLLGQFLKRRSEQLNIRHIEDKIEEVLLDGNDCISALVSQSGAKYHADLFVDCSGFSSVLMQSALKVGFKSFASNLFNDSAIAIPSEIGGNIPSETRSTAMKFGWRWKIPLTNRFGNGYVYSSNYCSPEQAETELRRDLGLLDSDVQARHLKMKVGRIEKHWYKNCLAIGLSQGFIEPLEATALFLVQQSAALFADAFEHGQFTDTNQDSYNDTINGYFEGIRDYIAAHYYTNSRTDSQYWLDCQNNHDGQSDTLKHILEIWNKGADLTAELRRLGVTKYYTSVSWHCLLAGMGVFPAQSQLRPPYPNETQVNMALINDFLHRCSLNFDPHREQLGKFTNKKG
ncbi:tryptophan halogenase family protein [Bowmanella yangjiangensis]|uniref:Tryptophan 7-halogenase n=1 Tax=Bowmanella yangjiangensis TaxID=2811230 RepID=A0ABS3CU72_9ALTE|nr:tryptophan halogenase family protein [Bowmanella yangjiangensis]MBN7820653.1 tryptophan 7-halogenase [Bowmanella yangjiangensis]